MAANARLALSPIDLDRIERQARAKGAAPLLISGNTLLRLLGDYREIQRRAIRADHEVTTSRRTIRDQAAVIAKLEAGR
jgi:hypothetical protein